MLRKRLFAFGAVAVVACALAVIDAAPARAAEPLVVTPAVYRVEGDHDNGASVQLVRHWHGGYGYGYGYRPYGFGIGVGVYRPYPVYAPGPYVGPVYGAPVYGAPVYGYPAYAYPSYGYGYGYGYRGCW